MVVGECVVCKLQGPEAQVLYTQMCNYTYITYVTQTPLYHVYSTIYKLYELQLLVTKECLKCQALAIHNPIVAVIVYLRADVLMYVMPQSKVYG